MTDTFHQTTGVPINYDQRKPVMFGSNTSFNSHLQKVFYSQMTAFVGALQGILCKSLHNVIIANIITLTLEGNTLDSSALC